MDNFERKTIESYHIKNINNRFLIDSQTRKDLNLDDFYKKFNKTKTSYGDQVLYHYLNSQPDRNLKATQQVIEDIKDLRNNSREVHLISKNLSKIGKQTRGNVYKDLWDGLKYRPKFLKLIPILFTVELTVTCLLFLLSSFAGLLGVMTTVIINLGLFLATNRSINYSAGSMNYLIKTLSVLKKVNTISPSKCVYRKELNIICRYGIYIKDGLGPANPMTELSSAILDYIRMFFCAELYAYYKISKYIDNYQDDVREVIEYTGYLDFLLNTVEIMSRNKTSTPQFTENREITFRNLSHPLLDNCTPYNHYVDNSTIITGMNMAGKSTFMKSIALNQILATSLGFTFSESFETPLLYVVTSIKIEDDIRKKKSKYYIEAERLLYIQNLLKNEKILCIIDEILTGTNTDDRIDASIGLLKNYYNNKGSLIMAATHDVKIANDLSGKYDSYYFDGELVGERIIYDYAPHKGIVTKRNAMLLLQNMGIKVN